MLGLGLRGLAPDQWDLRPGVRHHLALALFAGAALFGLLWGTARFLAPEETGAGPFRDLRFWDHVIEAHKGGRTWLGSPWFLTDLGQYRALGEDAEGEAALPLANVNWEAAGAACEKLPPPPSEDGEDWKWELTPGLASEAQWEFAARAGAATRWSVGDDPAVLDAHAWFRGNAENTTRPVGGKAPNGLCLADMHGNLWEWVGDCFDADAYRSRADSLALEPRVEPAACDTRVIRGGSFVSPPAYLRSAGRNVGRPDVRNGTLGLRCVRSRVRQP